MSQHFHLCVLSAQSNLLIPFLDFRCTKWHNMYSFESTFDVFPLAQYTVHARCSVHRARTVPRPEILEIVETSTFVNSFHSEVRRKMAEDAEVKV